MKKLLSPILYMFGYEWNPKDSLLLMHIQTFTNSSWLEDIHNNNTIQDYYTHK